MLEMFETNRTEAVGDRKGWEPEIPKYVSSKYSTIDRYHLNLNKIKCNNGKLNWNATVEFEWDGNPDERIIEYVFVSEKNISKKKKQTRILLNGRAHQIGHTDKIIENVHFRNNKTIQYKNPGVESFEFSKSDFLSNPQKDLFQFDCKFNLNSNFWT